MLKAGIPRDLLLSADAHEESALFRRRTLSLCQDPNLQVDLADLCAWADRLGLQGALHYVLQAVGTVG